MAGTPLPPETWDDSREFLDRFTRRLTLDDEHSAEDLTQDVWLAALRAARPSIGRRWLAGVARNLSFARLRRSGRRRQAEESYVPGERDPSPLESMARESLRTAVEEAVNRLREPYRSTVRHHFYDGLTTQSIADRAGLSVDTVRTRLKRGLALLEDDLRRGSRSERRGWLDALVAFFLRRDRAPRHAMLAVSAALTILLVTGLGLRVVRATGASLAEPDPESAALVADSLDLPDGASRRDPATRAPARTPRVTRTNALSGTVLGPLGLPRAGARVTAWILPPQRVLGSVPAADFETTADGNGGFRLDGLPDSCWVYAEALELVARELLHVDFTEARETDGVVFGLERSRTVAGRVLDEAGRPVPGVVVTLQGSASRTTSKRVAEPGMTFIRQLGARTETDGAGEFELTSLTDSTSSLWFEHPDWTTAEKLVSVGSAFVEVELARGGALTMLVVDADGAPAPGARIRVFADNRIEEGVTDSAGRATIAPVALPLVLCASAQAPGTASRVLGWTSIDPGDRPVRLALPRSRSVRGQVIDPAGAPVLGARLRAHARRARADPDVADTWNRVATADIDRVGEATCDEAGNFAFACLPDERLELEVESSRPGAGTLSFELEAGVTALELRLVAPRTRGTLLRGRVRSAYARDPLGPATRALVQAFETRGSMRTVRCPAGERGEYELFLPEGGPWKLCASAAGHAPRVEDLQASEGTELHDIDLHAERTLDLWLTDEHGVELSGGVLLLRTEDGAPLSAAAHGEAWRSRRALGIDGRARLAGLPAVPVVVTYLPAGLGAPRERRIDLTDPPRGPQHWPIAGTVAVVDFAEVVLEFRDESGQWFAGEAGVELRDGEERSTHAWSFVARPGECRLDPRLAERVLKFGPTGEPSACSDRGLDATEWHALERAPGLDARFPRFDLRVRPGQLRLLVDCEAGSLEQVLNTKSGERRLVVVVPPKR